MKNNKNSKTWLAKSNKEYFFKKAKVHGYRSRSAYKLIEMNNKFKFIKNESFLLDLGSSPGGWSQVASEIINNGKILSTDIKNMEEIKKDNFILFDENERNLASGVLNENGVFISKIFMGSIFTEIQEKAKKYFKKVIKYKPLSSKSESKEIYIFCKGLSKIL